MALQKQDRIKQLAESLKGSLDRGVDAIADKIRTAQVFAEEQSDVFDQKNQASMALWRSIRRRVRGIE